MSDFEDDSFDVELANLEIPTIPKVAKLSTSTDIEKDVEKPTSSAKSIIKKPPNPHCVLVHPKQRGNPILKSINSVPIEFRDDIVPDYVVGATSCVLYLSLKYHALNPDYICQRLKTLGKQYELRVLLVQIDTPDPFKGIKNLTRISLLTDLTLILAWNNEEAGKIIESYKILEKRAPDLIKERVENSPHAKLVAALSHVKPLNKTDAVTLLQNFGNLEKIVNASEERLSQVVGLGPRKAKTLYKTLHEPFLSG